MPLLNEDQKKKSLSLLDAFIAGGEIVSRKEGLIPRIDFQNLRIKVIAELQVYIQEFQSGKIDINSFKTKIDSINKRNNHWGFTAIKGQMFFNQLVRVAPDKEKLTQELKSAISPPRDIADTKVKINSFADYVTGLGVGAKDRRMVPKVSSVLYFLSYFWQVFDYGKYPIFYHSIDSVFQELDFMSKEFDSLGEKYIYFTNLLEELRNIFEGHAKRNFSFWDIEHIFWYFYIQNTKATATVEELQKNPKKSTPEIVADEDYIPPVVEEIPQLALDDEVLIKKYGAKGKKVEDVFEDKLYKIFVMLGYNTERLGKGKGRVPDGIARATQDNYAVIYDAKSRKEPYGIGTDSRAIIEYINTCSHKLRREGIKNIYFAIISSGFKDGQDDTIKEIKMETGVQEFLLLPAELLLDILEIKLRDSEIELGKYGLQRIFQHHGLITRGEIQEILIGM